MSRRHVWVEAIMQLSGKVIHSGFVVGCLLIIGVLERRKCPVVPESNIPCSIGVWSSLFMTLLHTSLVQLEHTTVMSLYSLP